MALWSWRKITLCGRPHISILIFIFKINQSHLYTCCVNNSWDIRCPNSWVVLNSFILSSHNRNTLLINNELKCKNIIIFSLYNDFNHRWYDSLEELWSLYKHNFHNLKSHLLQKILFPCWWVKNSPQFSNRKHHKRIEILHVQFTRVEQLLYLEYLLSGI